MGRERGIRISADTLESSRELRLCGQKGVQVPGPVQKLQGRLWENSGSRIPEEQGPGTIEVQCVHKQNGEGPRSYLWTSNTIALRPEIKCCRTEVGGGEARYLWGWQPYKGEGALPRGKRERLRGKGEVHTDIVFAALVEKPYRLTCSPHSRS